jgi:signal transduction histidine kinase
VTVTGSKPITDPTRDDPIRQAAERVLARGPGGRAAAAADTPRRAELERLVEALQAAVEGAEIPPVQSASGDALWLLRALRTEVIAAWPEGRPLLPVMRAFETMQRRLLGANEGSPVEEILTPFARSLLREVAHMIRSPLGSIVMMADTLIEQGDQLAPERRSRQHAIIYRAALGLAQVAGELLTLVEERELEPDDRFSLEQPVDLVADIIRPVTEARGCELSVSLPEESVAVAPPGTLTRAMLALTLRAALRAREGSVDVEVKRDSGEMEFVVTARGAGVLPDGGVAELLELFRAEPDTGGYTLSAESLGLTATAHLIRSMGAELSVDAPSADELRLSFTLPQPPGAAPS